MSWPDGIAAVLGCIALALILTHQHRSPTEQPDPQDGTGERP